MALSRGEAAVVLSLINGHHGNARWDDLQLEAFHGELLTDMTAVEAREAVRRWYAANDSGRWMGSGDLNAMVRRMRGERRPSEAQIGRETAQLGLDADPDAAWRYRRARLTGRTPEQSRQAALDAPQRQVIEPGRPKPTPVRRFAGALPVGSVPLTSMIGGHQ